MGLAWLAEWRARPLLLVALALCGGEWLFAAWPAALSPLSLFLSLASFSLLAVWALLRRSAWAIVCATTLAAALLGALRLASVAVPRLDADSFLPSSLDKRITISGRVLEAPERVGDSAEIPAELLAIGDPAKGRRASSGRLLIHLSPSQARGPLPLAAGECFDATVTPRAFRSLGLPGETPLWRAAFEKRQYAEAWLPDAARLHPAACPGAQREAHLFEAQRSAFANWLDVSLPRAPAEILKSLSIGMGRGLPDNVRRSFQQAGISHVLSISGLHVAVLAFLVFIAARGVFRRSVWLLRRFSAEACAALLTLPLVWAYAILAGLGAPIWRSALMISVFLLGRVLARKADALNSLALAVCAILVLSPTAVFDLGFQLSVLSVLALIVGMGRLWRLLPKGWRAWLDQPGSGRLLLRRAFEVAGGTLLCWLATLPLVAPAFHKVALASFWANLLLVPLYTWLVLPLLAATQLLFAFGAGLADGLLLLLGHVVTALLAAQNALLGGVGLSLNVPPQPGLAWALLLLALLAATQAFLPRRGLRGRPDLPVYPERRTRASWVVAAGLLLALAGGASVWAWHESSISENEAGVWLLPTAVGPIALGLRPEGAELLTPGRLGRPHAEADQKRLLALLEGLGLTRLDRLWLLSGGRDEWSAGFALSDQVPVGRMLDELPKALTKQCRTLGPWRRCRLDQGNEASFENLADERLGLRWRILQLSFARYELLVVSQPWRLGAEDWARILPFVAAKPLALVLVGVPTPDALETLALRRKPEVLAFALTSRHGHAFGRELWQQVLRLFGQAARTDKDGVLHLDANGELWARGRRFAPSLIEDEPEAPNEAR